jgi:cytochrome P450
MVDMIHARRAGNKPERYDLLSSLVDANDNPETTADDEQMLDSELIGSD